MNVRAGDMPDSAGTSALLDEEAAWAILGDVLDPEVPALSVVDLGIVREITAGADGNLQIVVTPTYSGCPATEVIAESIRHALLEAGARSVEVRYRLAPAWTSDWLGREAHDKLRRYGISPPAHWVQPGEPSTRTEPAASAMRFFPRAIECPRCGSRSVEQLSEFGATACKALWRCISCREPFEYFKPI